MTKYDPETGLPQLPENMRWRIAREEWAYSNRIVVRLEKSYPSLFGRTKWFSLYGEFVNAPDQIGEVQIRTTAERVLTMWRNDVATDKFIGVYPPKSL